MGTPASDLVPDTSRSDRLAPAHSSPAQFRSAVYAFVWSRQLVEMRRRERWPPSRIVTTALVIVLAGLGIVGKLLWFGRDRDAPLWVYPVSVLVLVVVVVLEVVARSRLHWSGGSGSGSLGEQVVTVAFEDGMVVIRGATDGRIGITHDEPWKAEVRQRSKDPFGPPVWTGHAPNRAGGIDLTQEVARQIRSGDAPWG